MQAIINRDSLNSAATFAKRVAEKRSTVPVLTGARLRSTPAGLALTTTDLDRWATVILDGSADDGFDVVLPARQLADVVKRTKSDLVAVDTGTLSCAAALDFEGARVALNSIDADFPEFPGSLDVDAVTRFEIGSDLLAEAFGSVEFAISTEETRYYLNGIYMHVTPAGELRTVATDGHRLATYTWAVPDGADGMPGVIIPRATVADVLALIGKRKPPLPVRVTLNSTHIEFVCGTVTIQSKLVDGTFPDYQRVTPVANDKHLTVNRARLADILKAVSAVSDGNRAGVRLSVECDGDGAAILTASIRNAEDGGAASDCMEAEARGFGSGIGSFEIGFNAGYILDILDVFALPKGAVGFRDEVTFRFSDPGSPAVIVGTASHARVLTVLMPRRV